MVSTYYGTIIYIELVVLVVFAGTADWAFYLVEA